MKGNPLGATIPDFIKNSPIHMDGVYWDEKKQQYYVSDTKSAVNVQRIGDYTFDGTDETKEQEMVNSYLEAFQNEISNIITLEDDTEASIPLL